MAKPHYKPMTIPNGYHKGITGWVVVYEVRYLYKTKRKPLHVKTVFLKGRGYTPGHAMYNLSKSFTYARAVHYDPSQRLPGVPVRWQPMTEDEAKFMRTKR